MEENPKPRRRWYRFSLRTLFVASLLIGFGCAWVGMQLQQKRRHEAVVNEILKLGGRVHFSDAGEVPAWKEWLFRRKEWLFGSYAFKPLYLNLANTDATDSLLSQTPGMNLIALNLDSTKVTDAGLTHLEGFSSLNELYLANTQVSGAGLTHLKELTRLQYLGLSNTQVTDAGLPHLNRLTNLQDLDLSDTHVTDAGLTHLEGLTNLRRLFLNNTQITDAGLTHLAGMVGLLRLSLGNTQVTDADLDKLGKAIPGCMISYTSEKTPSAPAAP